MIILWPSGRTLGTLLPQVCVLTEWARSLNGHNQNTLTTAITGISTPRFPALLDAWWKIKRRHNFTRLFSCGVYMFLCLIVYLQSWSLVGGSLTRSLPFQTELDKQFQKVHHQFVHKLLAL